MRFDIKIDGTDFSVTMPDRGIAGKVWVRANDQIAGDGFICRTGRWTGFEVRESISSQVRRCLMDAIKQEHQKREEGDATRGYDDGTGTDSADRS